MEQKILVPLDGTPLGEAVLPKLENLVFKGMPGGDIEVTLLRVVSNLNFNYLTTSDAAQLARPDSEMAELAAKEQGYLDSVAGKIKVSGVRVKTRIAVGNAAEEIIKVGHEIGASLIAMSTHGRNGFVRWAIGSVTDRVIRLEGKIPVLAVHALRDSRHECV